MSRAVLLTIVAVVVAAGAVALALTGGSDDGTVKGASARQPGATGSPVASGKALARSVTVTGLREHLKALQRIADAHQGTRAAGSPGDRASERYVAEKLRAAGWRVHMQPVHFPYSAQRKPPRLEADGREIESTALRFSASGKVDAPLASGGTGCLRSDYGSLPAGSIALVRRGGCFLRQIVLSAQAAGAAGVVIYDPSHVGPPLPGTLISPGPRIPAVTIRREDGEQLASELPRVHLEVESIADMRDTNNVIAELGSGRRVVMAGAHLDSVPEGPGVNDDGSGDATLLELGEQLGRSKQHLPGTLRFAFWGAEELGLYGSRHYVSSLPGAERKRIAGYLNLDMVGSGNGGRLIYGGEKGPASDAADAVRDLFDSRGVDLEVTHPGGDSDHAPFEDAGIPIIGLFSGAAEIKRAKQKSEWGGTAEKPYDSCYHLSCDRLGRMDMRTLSELTDGAAVALYALAR